MSAGWLEVAHQALKIPGLIVEIYGDMAKPGVRQAGKALETVIGLGNTLLWPIALLNERSRIALERNLEKYRLEMQGVSEDQTIPVAPEIGVPIAEKLAYVSDEHLSELYVKLLAAASNKDSVNSVHPSFVNIIGNLSSDEAMVLKHFVYTDAMPIVSVLAEDVTSTHIQLASSVPLENVSSQLMFPQNCEAYFSNLAGLGLIDIRYDKSLAPSAVYEPLHAACRKRFQEKFELEGELSKRTLVFQDGCAIRTDFGHQFIRACHSPTRAPSSM